GGALLSDRTPHGQALLLVSGELTGVTGHGVLLLIGHPCSGRTGRPAGRSRASGIAPSRGQAQAPMLRSIGPNMSSAEEGIVAPLGARDSSRRAERRHTSLRPVVSAQCISTSSAACQTSFDPCSTA